LQPFLAAYVHPDEEDSNGVTTLCNAISQLNVEAVRMQLDAGADPNGRCRHESLVGSLVFMATTEKDDRRRDIMRALLEHGAPVTNIDACRSPTNGDCSQVLLPVMEQYSKSAK
jgi:ankyrin repeat protein